MKSLTAIVGGSVGSDPYAPNTWSGSAANLFEAMGANGLLQGRARGIDVPKPEKMLLMAKNFHRDRGVWRKHFFFDPAYRRALTRAAQAVPVPTPWSFQLGHMYSLAEAHPEARAISFHDGNLAELLDAGFNLGGVSRKRIDQALAYEREVAGEMTAVWTMSEYLRQSFVRQYEVPAEKVVNVGGAFNLKEIPAAPDAAKSYAEPVILFVGVEFERKGGPMLLEAFARLRERMPGAVLHVVGPQVQQNRQDGVVWQGRLNKGVPAEAELLDRLFREASLFVLPSLYEPFGIAPLEAMLYGLPCLVTRGWALQETVVEGVTGELVTKGDREELLEKLTAMLREPDRLRQMGLAGRERAMGEYTWGAVAGRMAAALGKG